MVWISTANLERKNIKYMAQVLKRQQEVKWSWILCSRIVNWTKGVMTLGQDPTQLNLCPGMVLYVFNPSIQERVMQIFEFKASLGKSKFQIQVWWHTPLIWAIPSAGGLHKDNRKRTCLFSGLLALTCQYICWNLLQDFSLYRKQLKHLASWDWVTIRFLDFPSTAALCWVS